MNLMKKFGSFLAVSSILNSNINNIHVYGAVYCNGIVSISEVNQQLQTLQDKLKEVQQLASDFQTDIHSCKTASVVNIEGDATASKIIADTDDHESEPQNDQTNEQNHQDNDKLQESQSVQAKEIESEKQDQAKDNNNDHENQSEQQQQQQEQEVEVETKDFKSGNRKESANRVVQPKEKEEEEAAEEKEKEKEQEVEGGKLSPEDDINHNADVQNSGVGQDALPSQNDEQIVGEDTGDETSELSKELNDESDRSIGASDDEKNKHDENNAIEKKEEVANEFQVPSKLTIQEFEDKNQLLNEMMHENQQEVPIGSWVFMVHLNEEQADNPTLEVALLHQSAGKRIGDESTLWITASSRFGTKPTSGEEFTKAAKFALKNKAQGNGNWVDSLDDSALHLVFGGVESKGLVAVYILYVNDKTMIQPPTEEKYLRELVEPKQWQWKELKSMKNGDINPNDITTHVTVRRLLPMIQKGTIINPVTFRRLMN